MASKILLKKSTTASSVPTTLDLDVGEVAINTEDKRLFTKDSGGSIVEVSTTPSTMDVDGNATVGGTLGVTGNTTVGGTLGVTGTTTLGTANVTTATVSSKLTVPTPVDATDAASKGYVDTEVSTAVANVIDASPAALDTLNELAAALGDDPNFSTTITTSIGTKLPKDGSEAMTGNLNLNSNHIVNVSDPSNVGDAANKNYVDTQDALKLSLTGGTMSGAIAMGTNKVTGMGDPTLAQDAATKAYVDSFVSGVTNLDQAVTDAQTAQTAAETAQTGAETAQTAAETAQTAAETAQANAEAVYDNFDDRYLGVKATAPALDNDGDALVAGALYFDSVVGAMYVYDGSTWSTVAPVATSVTEAQISDLGTTIVLDSDIGSTVQAYDAQLSDVAGLTPSVAYTIVGDGTNFISSNNSSDAILLPAGTDAERPASPVNGMIRYSTTSGSFEGYQAGAWAAIGGAGDVGAPTLSGSTSANEFSDTTVTITDYDSNLIYRVSVTGGSYVRSGGTITWTLPGVSADTIHYMTVNAIDNGVTSPDAEWDIDVLNVAFTGDTGIQITNFGTNTSSTGWNV